MHLNSSLDFSRTPIDETSTSTGSMASMLYTEKEGGVAPAKMCTEVQYS